ncbi:MAG: hypothetical protein ACRED8_08995 [Caulobacteraceae bacterium]
MNIVVLVRGRRLSNMEEKTQQIGWLEAVPAIGLDGLGSASYGPEAALAILAPLGAASLVWIGWVVGPDVARTPGRSAGNGGPKLPGLWKLRA